MAQQVINLGTGPDTPGGDSRYTAFDKTRANVAELYVVTDAISAFGKTLIDDADNTAARTTLGLGTAATSASTSFVASSAVSAFGLTLIDDANNGVARATLGLGTAAVSATTDFAPSSALTTVTVSTKTANYTLVLTDAGTAIDMNLAGANTVTVPLNATAAFPTTTVLEVCQIGAGITSISPASGATLNGGTAAIALRTRYSTVSLRKLGTDAWIVSGDFV